MKKKAALQAGELDWQQSRFVEHYISNGGNATQAYIAAGYSRKNADSNACRLLKHENIQVAIRQERDRLQSMLGFKREDHIKILHGMATARTSDFAGIDPEDRETYKGLGHLEYAIEQIEPTKFGTRLKLHSRTEALNELAEILGYKVIADTDGFDDLDSGMASTVERVSGRRKRA